MMTLHSREPLGVKGWGDLSEEEIFQMGPDR